MIGSAGTHDMRVLMTTDAIGGVWQYSVDLAKELRARGAAITLAVLGPPPKPDQKAVAADLDILVTGLPLDWTADTREQVLDAGRALGQLAERLRPDIIHLNSPALAASAFFHRTGRRGLSFVRGDMVEGRSIRPFAGKLHLAIRLDQAGI